MSVGGTRTRHTNKHPQVVTGAALWVAGCGNGSQQVPRGTNKGYRSGGLLGTWYVAVLGVLGMGDFLASWPGGLLGVFGMGVFLMYLVWGSSWCALFGGLPDVLGLGVFLVFLVWGSS